MKDYIFSNDFTKNIDAMIYTCGYENCEPGHSYGPLLRNGYMVHYILSGKGVYQCRGRTFHLGEGEAFLICPGELIYYLADKFPNRRPAGAEKRSNYVEEALNFIEGAFCDPITVQDIADHLCLNRSYLHRRRESAPAGIG
nr:AraC family ligand binding domain-containing protein [uncultured Oscillibacter sp.]